MFPLNPGASAICSPAVCVYMFMSYILIGILCLTCAFKESQESHHRGAFCKIVLQNEENFYMFILLTCLR